MCWASFFALTRRLQCRWASFFALTPTSGRAGRRMSRTKRGNMATLKPASPLRPKTALKHPFLTRKGDGGFNWPTSPARKGDGGFRQPGHLADRARPPGRQGQAAAPAGGGWASPRRPWAISVTNVVKPTRFKSPREDPCYKRRQSASKNLDFQRKSRWIDDVCNNTHQGTPETQHASPRDAHRE